MTLLRLIICFYMICYALLDDHLAKRMKESSYLNLMLPSRRLIAIMFLYGSLMGILNLSKILGLLINQKTPTESNIISTILFGFILILTIRFRKATWYYLTKNKRTIVANWYVQKYFKLSKKEPEQAYEYLKKASMFKTDSVFIWSMIASFNEFYLRSPNSADAFLLKARQALDTPEKPSNEDKALLESVKGEIQLHRNNITEGLDFLKNAYKLDHATFYKEKYEKALKWIEQNNESQSTSNPPDAQSYGTDD